jgi:pseudoazurin
VELKMKMGRFFVITVCISFIGSTYAAEHVVKGVVTKWRPMITFAEPGDTVRFIGMIGHNTVVIPGMIPENAIGWDSKYGEEDFTITVTEEGAYIFKCTPHITTGMVGAIVVGNAQLPQNLSSIEGSLAKVTIGKRMVARTIKKMKSAVLARSVN